MRRVVFALYVAVAVLTGSTLLATPLTAGALGHSATVPPAFVLSATPARTAGFAQNCWSSALCFTVGPSPVDLGVNVTFTLNGSDVTSNGCAPWSVGFGDGNLSSASLYNSGDQVVHAYAVAGSLVAVAEPAANGSDCGWIPVTIPVHATLEAGGVIATPSPGVIHQPVLFRAATLGGTPPYQYQWSFGDGGTTSTLAPLTNHTYAKTGTYGASVTVTDSFGEKATAPTTATPVVPFQVSAGVGAATVTVDWSASFTAITNAPNATFLWSFGDGRTGTGPSPVHVYYIPGNYTATVTATDPWKDVNSSSVGVTIVPRPLVGVTGSRPVADIGTVIRFSVSVVGGAGPYTYVWSFGDGSVSTLPAPTHAYQRNGSYVVVVRLTGIDGFPVTAGTPVTVHPLPVGAGFSASETTVPVGILTVLTAAVMGGTGPFSYNYSGLPPGCASANAGLLLCTPSAPGSYKVQVAITDSAGATVDQTLTLTVTAVGHQSSSSSPFAQPATGDSVTALSIVVSLIAVTAVVLALLRRGRPPTIPTTPGITGPPPTPFLAPPPPALPPWSEWES